VLKSIYSEGVKSDETTIISSGVRIEGKVTSTGNIRIDGEIQGDISSKSNVIVGESGTVNGQIDADSITIAGKVSGSLKAKDKINLETKANFEGDLSTKILIVEAGAKFEGESKMSGVNKTSEMITNPKPNISSAK
jgi:cytoskeletal protein CcmA (bactofilin family)